MFGVRVNDLEKRNTNLIIRKTELFCHIIYSSIARDEKTFLVVTHDCRSSRIHDPDLRHPRAPDVRFLNASLPN